MHCNKQSETRLHDMIWILLRLLMLTALLMAGSPAGAATEGAADFVQRVAHDLLDKARTHQNEHADAAGTWRELFPEIDSIMGDAVAWPTISRGVAGKYYDQFSEGQKEAFSRVFRKSLGELLARSLADLRSYSLAVGDVHGDGVRAQVPAVVQTAEGASFEISFSIAADSGYWQVRNLIFSGVNLGLTYRNQFSELMRTRDGNIDAVIKDWSEVIDKTG